MKVTGPDWPSTKALAAALAEVKSDLVVRWGSGGKDGAQQLEAFRTAGVACPEFTRDLATAKQWVRGGLRVFGRHLHHTQGNDIIGAGYKEPSKAFLSNNRARGERFNPEWLKRQFWVKVIPSVGEYRQHIWDGHCIRVGKKVQVEQPKRIQPVRSRNNGWHIDYGYKSPNGEFTERLRDTARRAVSACGYLGGAVDILQGEDGQLYVLEVNSAPALTDANTLGAYVKGITRWAKRENRIVRHPLTNV